MPNIPSEIALLEDEIASLQFVAALTRVPRIREAAKLRLAARRRRLRKLNNIALLFLGGVTCAPLSKAPAMATAA